MIPLPRTWTDLLAGQLIDHWQVQLRPGLEGLTDDESAALNARLILILANHIGDRDTFRAALKAAAPPA